MKAKSLQFGKAMSAAMFVLLLVVMGMTKARAEEFVYNSLKYRITGTNTVTLIGHTLGNQASGLLMLTSVVMDYQGHFYNVTQIGAGAFSGCTQLSCGQLLSIPNSVTSIGNYAFSGCTGMAGSLTIPNSVTDIGVGAFSGCTGFNLTLTIPESATNIGVTAFYGTGFSTVRWNAINCSDVTPLSGYNSLFGSLTNLRWLYIGSNVQRIPANVFYGCTYIQTMSSQAEVPPAVANNAFAGLNTSLHITVPCGTTSAYQSASGWSVFSFLESGDCLYYITGLADPAYAGSVSGSGTYNNGTNCTMTAVPNSGYAFIVWTENGTQVSTDATYSFTATCDRMLVAHFQQQSYTINVSSFPSAGGSVTGSGNFTYGNTCTVTATANPGFHFVNWTENGNQVSTDAIYTFTVTDSRDLVANFVLDNVGPEQISFADAKVKALCVANWDTNGDGELSYEEAAAVTNLGSVFENDQTIVTFDELQYFTGLTTLKGGYTTHIVLNQPITMPYGEFYGCTNLTSLLIPNSVTTIQACVFQSCQSLGSIEIPEGVTSIGKKAFSNCTGLTSMTVNAVTPPTLDENVFQNVSASIPIHVPCASTNSYMITSGWNVFTNYQGMDCIYHQISASSNPAEGGTVSGEGNYVQGSNCTLTAIANMGFAFANWTENGTVVSTNPIYSFTVTGERNLVANFNPINYDDIIVFADDNVKALCVANWDTDGDGELSFDEAAAVTNLGDVFSRKTTITSFNELQYFTGLTSISGHYSYVNVGNNTMQEQPFGAFTRCTNLTSVIIPNTVTTLYCAFNGCESLSSIDIPNSVISIGRGTFYQCHSLTSIVIPNSVSSIDLYAFYQCTGLVSLEIGNSVLSIGNKAFYGCSNLASLTVRTVTPPTLGTDVFYNVVKAIPVNVYTGTISSYQAASGWNEFTNYQGMVGQSCDITVMANPTIGGAVTGGGTYAQGELCTLSATPNTGYSFVNWTENGIQVSTNATYVFSVTDARALVANFNQTNSNTTITFADENVKELCITNWDTDGDGELSYDEAAAVTDLNYVFKSNQTIISFDELQYFIGVTEIKGFARTMVLPNHQFLTVYSGDFLGCNNLTSIVIPNSVIEIESYAFKGCQSLASLVIPSSITSIGIQSFYNCNGLMSMTVYAETPPTLGNLAFSNVDKSIPVYVPVGKVAAYQATSGWNEFTNLQEIPIPSYVITTTASPAEGGTVTGCDTYSYGTSCTLTATPNQGYLFVNWTENGNEVSTDASYTFTVTEERFLVANFNSDGHEITAIANPTDGGTIEGAGCYNEGGSCTLTAITNDGYSFVNWTENGNEVSTSPVYTFTVTEDRILVANFSMNSYEITATTNPTDGGEIVGMGNYFEGMSCTLTAIANEGYTFVNWTENGSQVSTDAAYTFIVTAERTLVANFSLNSYEIAATAYPTEGGEVTGSGIFTFGTPCIMTAVANEGYTFINWTENGNHVSTDAIYSFEVTGARTFVANFSLNIYAVTASAHPAEGGTVTGGGIYDHGASCSLIATANEGYNFVNWTENGMVVSTNPSYSFTVTETATYVANFQQQTQSYAINVSANPAIGGTVTGGGTYAQGTTCTLTATPAEGYTFVNWTENSETVSTDATYSFEVTEARNLVANFAAQGPVTNYWTPIGGTQYNMTMSGIIIIDGVEQTVTTLEVGAFCGDECRGSMMPEFFPPTQQYVVSLTVVSNQQSGENITFRLYDHLTQQELDLQCSNSIIFESNAIIGTVGDWYQFAFNSEVSVTATVNPEGAGTVTGIGTYMSGTTATLTATANNGYVFRAWTLNGETVSTDNPYSFTVIGVTNLVAQFDLQQSSNLPTGWSWWSTYVEMNGNNGLQQLEESLGHNGLIIKTQTPYVQNYYPSLGYDYWFGSLSNVGLTNEAGYQISVSNACQAVVSGAVADATAHPITIAPGWNWIGYPVMTQQSLSTALADFTPAANDLIKGQNSSATYYANYGWFPTSFTLSPGQGYMYLSNATENKTLTYAVGRGYEATEKAPERIWTNNEHAFADNLTVMAVVAIDGEEQRSEALELGAFVGGECRGSAVLTYFEPTDRWYALLTVAGEEGEEINFAVIDRRKGNTNARSTNRVVFVDNAVVGNLDQPYEVDFATEDALRIYPNPVERNEAFMLDIPSNETVAEMFVCNVLGDVVLHKEGNQDGQQISGVAVSGVYTVKVVCKSGNVYVERLIVK